MTIAQLEIYFRNLAVSHVDVDNFVWGDAFEQVQGLLKDLTQVVMVVDSPDFAHDNNNFTGRSIAYNSELVILKLTNSENKATKQNDLISTMDIILEVIRKIEEDLQNNDVYEFSLKSNLTQTFLDNRIGWRVSFSISFDVNVGINSTKWL
jgi:hypothetical protein